MQYVIIAIAFAICFLCICGLQAALRRWLFGDFIPGPSQQAETEDRLAKCLNKGNQGNNKNGDLRPSRQEHECNEEQNNQYNDGTPTLLFASVWTHFELLTNKISTVIIELVKVKCKGK